MTILNPPKNVKRLAEYAEKNKGKPYDISNLFGFDTKGKEICSSAVASCLGASGVRLQNHGRLISPNNLSVDPALTKIGEFNYGGWGFDRPGLEYFFEKHIATPTYEWDFIPPPFGGAP